MAKHAKDNRPSNLKPPINIELSDKHIGWRIAAIVLCILIAAGSIITILFTLLNKEDGYKTIESDGGVLGFTDEIVFNYNLGFTEDSATVEYKKLQRKYTEHLKYLYDVFNMDEDVDNIVNLHTVMTHKDEELTVGSFLYNAFEMLEKYNSRYIYLAPIFTEYLNLFYSGDDSYAKEYDPYFSEEQSKYFKEVLGFVNNPEHINIELLGDRKIKFTISPEYQNFIDKNGIEYTLDFANIRNAFVVDYIADKMIADGYTMGSVVSTNGYSRNLGNRDELQSLNIFDNYNDTIYNAGRLETKGASSYVNYKAYAMTTIDTRYAYKYKDGTCVTLNIDTKDGKYKYSTDNLLCYSKDRSCVEVLLETYHLFVNDSFNSDALNSLMSDKEIASIWCDETTLFTTGDKNSIKDLFVSDKIKYELAE